MRLKVLLIEMDESEDLSAGIEVEQKVKRFRTPQEKKRLSLANDRRNAYGESRANSRHSIRKNKMFPNRSYRHRISQVLGNETKDLNEGNLEKLESKVKEFKRRNWKKYPDVPLIEWIKNRFEYRRKMFRAKIKRQARRKE